MFILKLIRFNRTILLAIILFASTVNADINQSLTLQQAVFTAQQKDLWLVKNRHSQDAIISLSESVDILPNPKVTLGIANIASDSFDFNQEAMTQLKVGVSQMFPRGDTLTLRKQRLQHQSNQFPFQRKNRKAQVVVRVANLWLDAFDAEQSIRLIEDNRALFEQLADVAQASYSSAVGKTRQQDIVRAQLELTRLDDRLSRLKQKQGVAISKLIEWLNQYPDDSEQGFNQQRMSSQLQIADSMPNIRMLQPSLYISTVEVDHNKLYEHFSAHPALRVIDQKVMASSSSIKLARQKYKPQWGLNAGYGYRGDMTSGVERSDLFSIGVSFDMPLFNSVSQDKQLQSALSKSASVKTDKWLLIRQMISSFETTRVELNRINERQALYAERLLPQMHEQAEASLTAYTNDDGDFSEVVRSRIAELNAAIDALGIDVERQKKIIQLNYYFMRTVDDITQSQSNFHPIIRSEGAKS